MSKSLAFRVADRLAWITQSLSELTRWLTLAMVIVMFSIVVLRYGFNLGWIALQESVMYFHAFVIAMGAAHTLAADQHVRVDIFYRGFSERKKAMVDAFGAFFLLMPVTLFILIASWGYVSRSWQLMETSQASGGLPFVFILKTMILILAGSLFIQSIVQAIHCTTAVRSKTESKSNAGDQR